MFMGQSPVGSASTMMPTWLQSCPRGWGDPRVRFGWVGWEWVRKFCYQWVGFDHRSEMADRRKIKVLYYFMLLCIEYRQANSICENVLFGACIIVLAGQLLFDVQLGMDRVGS